MHRLLRRSGSYMLKSRSTQQTSFILSFLLHHRPQCWTSPVNTTLRNEPNNIPSSSFSSSSSSSPSSLSPFDPKNVKFSDHKNTSSNHLTTTKTKKRRRTFVPRIAAVQLTEKARKFFKQLLDNPIRPDIVGIMLNYDQSKSGEPRMVYTFQFVTNNDIDQEQDEGVSLELVPSSEIDPNTGEPILIPKPPVDCKDDGLPKLYIHHHAFLKILGATIDVDTETITPILYDREGNRMDPNS